MARNPRIFPDLMSQPQTLVESWHVRVPKDYRGEQDGRPEFPCSRIFGYMVNESDKMTSFRLDLYHDAMRLQGLTQEAWQAGWFWIMTDSATTIILLPDRENLVRSIYRNGLPVLAILHALWDPAEGRVYLSRIQP